MIGQTLIGISVTKEIFYILNPFSIVEKFESTYTLEFYFWIEMRSCVFHAFF